ncbi:hypothetical protein OBBRIDRAFT_793956 [Obba rivulosa]|uniref:Uncharacterized protein n=1 Tax=Obba rivulosa TaxID=1052685 RepID=A0A8E2DJU0_9APHY|nr:hypothetical protein OBBRIDRAFT_793956 [Obba rivulosa]
MEASCGSKTVLSADRHGGRPGELRCVVERPALDKKCIQIFSGAAPRGNSGQEEEMSRQRMAGRNPTVGRSFRVQASHSRPSGCFSARAGEPSRRRAAATAQHSASIRTFPTNSRRSSRYEAVWAASRQSRGRLHRGAQSAGLRANPSRAV